MDLLITALQDISVSNGYLTNIGQYVSHWDVQVIKHNDTYDVNVKDGANEHSLGHAETLNVKIALMCKTTDNYANLNSMMLDVNKCLFNNQKTIGDPIGHSSLRILPAVENVDLILDKENKKGFAELEFNIEHRITTKWQPDLTNYT